MTQTSIASQFQLPERQAKVNQILKSIGDESKDGIAENTEVYCICRSTDIARFMIGCDNCDEWYHGDCIGLTSDDAKLIKRYYCKPCREKNPALKLKYKKGIDKQLKRKGSEKPSSSNSRHQPSLDRAEEVTGDARPVDWSVSPMPEKHPDAPTAVEPKEKDASSGLASATDGSDGCGSCEACKLVDDCGKCQSCEVIQQQAAATAPVPPSKPAKDSAHAKAPHASAFLDPAFEGQRKLSKKNRPAASSSAMPPAATENQKRSAEQVAKKKKRKRLDSAQTTESEDELEHTVFCVTCGHAVNPKTALKHMERCFVKYESTTSFGSLFKTRIEGSLFCDYYNPQQKTYCKRLRVICPEHSKEPKVSAEEVCGCPLVKNLFESSGEFCRTLKRRCNKHHNWERLRRADIDMDRVREWVRLDEFFEQERLIRMSMANRAGLLGLLLNKTVDHSSGSTCAEKPTTNEKAAANS